MTLLRLHNFPRPFRLVKREASYVIADDTLKGTRRYLPIDAVSPLCADCTTRHDLGRRIRRVCRYCTALRARRRINHLGAA
jgi:hypothetical protein